MGRLYVPQDAKIESRTPLDQVEEMVRHICPSPLHRPDKEESGVHVARIQRKPLKRAFLGWQIGFSAGSENSLHGLASGTSCKHMSI
jgi:hypothetical protein